MFWRFLLLVALIAGAIAAFAHFSGKPDMSAFTGPFGEDRIAPRTPAIDALCKEYGGFKLNQSAENVAGFSTTLEPGCDSKCRLWLMSDKYNFVETLMSEGQWNIIKAGSLEHQAGFLVDGPGWYRFERTTWGDPRAARFEKTVRDMTDSEGAAANDEVIKQALSPEELKKRRAESKLGEFLGYAIIDQKIAGPTAPYHIQRAKLVDQLIDSETTRAWVVADTVTETATGQVLASVGEVWAAVAVKDRNGTVLTGRPHAFCGGDFSREMLLRVLKPQIE